MIGVHASHNFMTAELQHDIALEGLSLDENYLNSVFVRQCTVVD